MRSAQAPRIRTVGKATALFALHQFVGTFGVAFAAAVLIFFWFELLRPLYPGLFTSSNASRLLTGLPYFPSQVILGLWSGWSLRRRFRHRSMVWVWILPLVVLSYAVIAVPTMTPGQVPPSFQAGIGQSRLEHYFGHGCRIEERCTDQLGITMPFYVSLSYALGAFLASKLR
jgi:hypothetical protein